MRLLYCFMETKRSFIKKRTREALKSERVKRCAAAPALNCWLVVRWLDALRLVVSLKSERVKRCAFCFWNGSRPPAGAPSSLERKQGRELGVRLLVATTQGRIEPSALKAPLVTGCITQQATVPPPITERQSELGEEGHHGIPEDSA